MDYHYILKGKQPVPCPDLRAFSEFMCTMNNRRVAYTEIGEHFVSTVFLGIDHGFGTPSAPILFETMCFGPMYDSGESEYQTRCATWEEAEAMHEKAVQHLSALLTEKG